MVASVAATTDFVNVIASEMANAVERAVDCWMSQVEHALTDTKLTTLGRMNAVREVLEEYKNLTGRDPLQCRAKEL